LPSIGQSSAPITCSDRAGAQIGYTDDLGLDPVAALERQLGLEKVQLLLGFGQHQSAGETNFQILPELALECLP
jgi:hypothetical protein